MKNKIQYFENLRVVAIIGVILSHVVVSLSQHVGLDGITYSWWITNIIQTSTRVVVPLLFMMSGALLLDPNKQSKGKDFFKSRIYKIIIPFFSWNLIYTYISIGSNKQHYFVALMKSLTTPSFYHLWFVYTLVGLYLLTPFIRLFINSAKNKDILFLLCLWVFVTGLNPLIYKFTGYKLGVDLGPIPGFIGYYILGYYLQISILSNITKYLIYSIGLFGFLGSLLFTYLYTVINIANGQFKTELFFQDFPSIFIISMSISVFILFKHIKLLSTDISTGVNLNITRICYGVYLCHALVLSLLSFKFNIRAVENNLIPSILLTTLVTSVLCFGFFITLDWISNRYPLVNKLSRLIY